jgi:RimJ/RimL family protein N-acetyltransferase
VTEVPLLESGRLRLRGWRLDADDVELVVTAATDPQIRAYSSVGQARSPDDARRWLEARDAVDRLDWVVELSGEPAGRVSLAHIDTSDGVAEFGYWLLAAHRGQGLAGEAVRLVESYAFDVLQLGRLEIRHEPANSASCALAARCGYLAEGTARGAFVRGGRRLDLEVHARLASDRA